MNFDQFNEKSKLLINDAQNKAISLNHQQILPVHLLYSILEGEGDLILEILKDANISIFDLKEKIIKHLQELPSVSGQNLNIFFFRMNLLKLLKSVKIQKKNLMTNLYHQKLFFIQFSLTKQKVSKTF